MRKIFLFLFAAVLSIGTASAVTITLVDANEVGATLTLNVEPADIVVGDEVTASATHYDEGYGFAYWKENGAIVSYSADYTFTVTGDHTLEAYFGGGMPVEMTDLAVDGDAKTITGSNAMEGIETALVLDTYDSDMEMWSVNASASTISYYSTPLTILYSEVWLDMEAFSMAEARVVADFGGELFVFKLTMTAAADPINVEVETGLSLSFGNLIMSGIWTDEESGEEYPFRAEIGAFDHTTAEAEVFASVELGEWIEDADEQTRWFGFGQGLMTLTIADGVVTLTGSIVTNNPVNTLNVTATGMLEVLTLNLDATVEEMEMDGDTYLHLTAVDEESGMDFDLYLNDYTGADGEYELNEASTAAMGMATVTGSLTKSSNTYTGTLYAEAGTLYIFNMTLTKFVPTYDNINITSLTGQAEARYMGWGDEYYLALSLEGTWSDGVDTYPVLLEITDGYDATKTSGTVAVSLTIGGWGDDDPWLGSADGELSYTLSGKNITLKGKMENPYALPAAVYWDVNVSGTILPNYTRNVTAGNFGTICLPYGASKVEGATLWELAKAETDQVLLVSANKLEAGVPYIFEATATQIAVYCDATVADAASDKNGLYGTFTDETVVDAGDYILHNNELRPSDGTAKVNANRAYVVLNEVPTSHTPMPGRKYINMSVNSENAETGVENINGANDIVKMIENGQLIIVIDGVKYNAQGVRF